MKNAIIITAPIRSHVIPSFFLAEQLKIEYNITYVVNSISIFDLVIAQGYQAEYVHSERFASGYDPLRRFIENNSKINLFFFKNAFRDWKNQRTFNERKNDLYKIQNKLNAEIIIFDIFSSTDFYVLFPILKNKRVLFFSPMLSTYNFDKFPNVIGKKYNFTVLKQFFKKISPLRPLSILVGYDLQAQLKWIYKYNEIPKKYFVSKGNSLVTTIDTLPELVLAPHELEFSADIKLKNQTYLGLCLIENRIDTEVDTNFDLLFNDLIKSIKKEGKKIIYCAFGSFFTGINEHKDIAVFCLALFGAFHNYDNIHFILSINNEIRDAIKKIVPFPLNFSYFSKLRQLEVLKHSDLFITHGGLGSLKEAIYYSVPILVYPLDKKWDQIGNGQKVIYHKIGLVGDIKKEEPKTIEIKVHKLLNDNSFKINIANLSEKIKRKYKYSKDAKSIISLSQKI